MLPVDKLIDGSITDAEVVKVCADTIRHTVEPGYPDSTKRLFESLAKRLELVRLIEPRQTRAFSTYGEE
jgi:hypothetical protein